MRNTRRPASRIMSLLMAFMMLVSVLPSAAAAATPAPLAEGSYTVPVNELKSGAPIPAVAKAFSTAFGTEVQVDVAADGQMTATILPQHMIAKVGGAYHCNIMKVRSTAGEAAYPETKTELVSPTFGKPNATQDIQCPAKVVVVLPAANEQGLYPLEVTADFMNALKGNLEQDNWMNVTLDLDLANAKKIEAPSAAFPFGPAGTMLAPGEYDLPVALMNAGKHAQPSMAASAIVSGALEVKDNGDAYVTLSLTSVTVGTLTGWSSQWKVYNEYSVTSATTLAEVTGHDAEGHETAIRFKLPFTDKDGVYCTMFVEIMDTNPDAFLAIDFAKAAPKGSKPQPQEPEVKTGTANVCFHGDTVAYTVDAAVSVLDGRITGTELTYDADKVGGSKDYADKAVAGMKDKFTGIGSADNKAIYGVDTVSGATITSKAYKTAVLNALGLDFPYVVSNGTVNGKNYDMFAKVSVLDDKIAKVELTHNADTKRPQSVDYANQAVADMTPRFIGKSAVDPAEIQAIETKYPVDAVTKATHSCDSFKVAVLKALDLYTEPAPADLTFGSANTELKPGVYKVPMALRHADKHQNPSNAAGAFPAMGQLTVAQDGTATLTTDMQPVTIGPITDMAYNVLVYQEDNYTSATKPATVLASMKKPASMPSPDKDVPTSISFTIPNNDWDGVYLNFTVDAMGPGYPDAWLQLDYANAKTPGAAEHFQGSAKVNQFGKYTIHTDVTVQDGVIANVAVTADSFISETHRPTNEAKIAQVTEALKNTWNGMAPKQENAEKIFKAIMNPQSPDDVIDTVSGATYSAKAVRDAVMDAFQLEYQDEIINVPESVEPGVYEVEIGYYSDVVWHSLVETTTTKATLTINADKTMLLDFDTKSGTEKEPLYILGFNGIYPNNDKTQPLTKEGCTVVMGLSSNDYEDENFAKGTQVVNHLTFPLQGDLSKIYTTNCYLYVPAMKRLNGELSGVFFENGKFNVDIFAKIYWDGMKKIGDVEAPADEVIAGSAALRAGEQLNDDGTAPFILSLKDVKNVSALEVSFASDAPVNVQGLNGFAVTKQGDGKATLVYASQGQLSAQGAVDVVKFDVTSDKDVTFRVTGLTIAGRDSTGTAVFGRIVGGIDPSEAAFIRNIYDLNKDQVVDLLDMVIAQGFYQVTSADAAWNKAARCDFDKDGVIGITDYIDLCSHFNA